MRIPKTTSDKMFKIPAKNIPQLLAWYKMQGWQIAYKSERNHYVIIHRNEGERIEVYDTGVIYTAAVSRRQRKDLIAWKKTLDNNG